MVSLMQLQIDISTQSNLPDLLKMVMMVDCVNGFCHIVCEINEKIQ